SINLANHTVSYRLCPTGLATIAATPLILRSRNANWIGNRAAVSRKASTRPSSGTSIIHPGGNRSSSERVVIRTQSFLTHHAKLGVCRAQYEFRSRRRVTSQIAEQ